MPETVDTSILTGVLIDESRTWYALGLRCRPALLRTVSSLQSRLRDSGLDWHDWIMHTRELGHSAGLSEQAHAGRARLHIVPSYTNALTGRNRILKPFQ